MDNNATICYHCGDECTEVIKVEEKSFCCNGCKQVYLLLNENNLCSYYDFDKNPGIKVKGKFRSERFSYLDDEAVKQQLIQFNSGDYATITFSLPQMHCSSCVYLLENLHRIDEGILSATSNFHRKEVLIGFNPQKISLRKVVELLAFIGYEPAITLKEMKGESKKSAMAVLKRKKLYKIGISGFCFANIMMLSLPDYFAGGQITEQGLKETFIWLSFFLSLPVLFYGASDLFKQAWDGLKRKDINIDAPIVLAILMTFGRSYYEIFTGTGTGFLDSGTGIIFFMLVGRWFQDRTYASLSFDRDYQSYFPLGVTVIKNGIEESIPLTRLQKGDEVVIRHDEMIPADAVLKSGEAMIDYSFVSGENKPVAVEKGKIVYAGGKQTGSQLRLQVIKEPSQSYITELWNKLSMEGRKHTKESFVHPWSRYFTWVLLTIALTAGIYWQINDPAKVFPSVTAVLIVACPCSLLLTSTFSFGAMVRHLGRNKLYLKNASVIETLAQVDTIVFDKTGTLTVSDINAIHYQGESLQPEEKQWVKQLTGQSTHTLSKLIYQSIPLHEMEVETLEAFREIPGKGITGIMGKHDIQIGSASFTGGVIDQSNQKGSRVYVKIDGRTKGYFEVGNHYRKDVDALVKNLKHQGYHIHILSGDNESERVRLQNLLGNDVRLNFNVSPQDKLAYVSALQALDKKVLMVGDGINDAGALLKSDAGIAVNDQTTRFIPACDAIMHGEVLSKLDRFLKYAKSAKAIIGIGFVVSILYNFVGLSFAVRGLLEPVIAAILMPASSITLVLLATGLTKWRAKQVGL